MSCPSLEELLDALRARPGSSTSERVRRHVAGCASCERASAWLADVVAATAAGPLPEVPGDLLRAASEAPLRSRSVPERRSVSILERVRGALAQPVPLGVRGPSTGTRQLYAGPGAELDLEIVPASAPGALRLTGQLLLRDLPPPHGVLAALSSAAGPLARAEGDAAGIFVIPEIAAGVYRLSVWAPAEARGVEVERLVIEGDGP